MRAISFSPPLPVRRAAAPLALALSLAGCSFASEALWPSLAGGDPRGGAPPAQSAPAPARVEIPPSPAERAAEASAISGPAGAPASETEVGRRVAQMREEVRRLQSGVAASSARLQQIRGEAVQVSQRYYTLVGGINSRLQVGTTPGNPVLQNQWNQANLELDRISAEIGRMTGLSNEIASDAALAAFLLESVRAAYNLSGAIEEDHRQLAALEDEVNRTVVTIDRMMNELSEDIARQSAYVARERSNMSTLAAAIKNGELYGTGLGNRAFAAVPAANGPAPALAQPSAGRGGAAPAASERRPLVIVRFDRANPSYEQALYTAVSRALERRPQASFDIVAVAPSTGSQAQVALASTNAKKQAEGVYRSLIEMGLPAERMRLSAATRADIKANEVQLYVR